MQSNSFSIFLLAIKLHFLFLFTKLNWYSTISIFPALCVKGTENSRWWEEKCNNNNCEAKTLQNLFFFALFCCCWRFYCSSKCVKLFEIAMRRANAIVRVYWVSSWKSPSAKHDKCTQCPRYKCRCVCVHGVCVPNSKHRHNIEFLLRKVFPLPIGVSSNWILCAFHGALRRKNGTDCCGWHNKWLPLLLLEASGFAVM